MAFFVRLFERFTPGPYVLAVGAEHPNGSFSSNGIYGHEFFTGNRPVWCGIADSCLKQGVLRKSDKSQV